MKLSALVALCLLASFGVLGGCNRGSGKKLIAVVPKGQAHLFWQSVHAGAAKAASENNAEVAWNGPASEADVSGQQQIVERMINRHVDALVLAPSDKTALVGVVERAKAANIPVVIFDSGIDTKDFVAQVATDNYAAGKMGADRIGELLAGKGEVAMVKVQPGGASTMAREQGFQDELAAKYPNIKIVDQQYGMADFAQSLRVSEDMLAAHPKLDALFASNESSTIGAVQALKSRHSSVKLVGFDWSPKLKDDLESGVVDSLIVQDPFKMGYDAVTSALKALKGEQVAKIQDLAPRLVRKEDLNKPEVQAQLNPDVKKYLQ